MEKIKKGNHIFNLISEKEVKSLLIYFNDKFNCSSDSIDSSKIFYKKVLETLENKIELQTDSNLINIFNLAGFKINNTNKLVYVIFEYPKKIAKIEIKELVEVWDEIWSPPEDDAIIIHFPFEKSFLITHWDVVYFD